MLRRRLLVAGLALAGSPAVRAQKFSGGAPLRLGIDHALVESRLGLSLQRAFSADTGIAVRLVAGPALAVLEATQEGELDAALTNAPLAEAALEKQTLVHDRRAIATGAFVLVGPAAQRGRGKTAPAAGRSAVDVLAGIRDLAVAAPDRVVFLSAGDGSGTHVAEQALWRAAAIAPAAPWYASAAGAGFVAKVRARGAYALVERGAWSLAGGGLAVLADGDPLLAESVHAMRSFRATHPAGRIFLAWIGGGRGRAVVAAHRGYSPPG
ncbi:MAG: substrate-binding domain-containing protein [Caldimonas sp.]